MENMTEFYKTCVKRLLSAYQPLKTDCSEVELVFDDERMHYTVFRIGWRKHKRIHLCLVHIDICNDTIVIQANNTEDIIDAELIGMGIPKEKICLGLLPPDVRTYIARQEQTKPESFLNHYVPICQAA